MEGVVEAWRAVDLNGVRPALDEQALGIANQREASAKRRKQLGANDRAFRKGSDAEKLAGMKKLFKEYQKEVDALTERAKFSEGAFTALYARVHEAPDPLAHLEAAAAMEPELAQAREENDKLQDDLLRYRLDVKEIKQETSDVKNQDATIRTLQEKLKDLEQRYKEDTSGVVAEEEAARAQQEAEALRQQLEAAALREAELKRQLDVAAETAQQARTAHDAAQARLLEVESTASTLDRAQDAERELVRHNDAFHSPPPAPSELIVWWVVTDG